MMFIVDDGDVVDDGKVLFDVHLLVLFNMDAVVIVDMDDGDCLVYHC
jgi:hypothetical protein